MKKSTKFLLILLTLTVIVSIVIIYKYNNKPSVNPENVLGNTTCNILNGGKFCEYKDYIYFSNPNHNNYLYRMDLKGNNITLLSEVSADNINVYGDYIYYSKHGRGFLNSIATGINRCNLKGKDTVEIDTAIISELMLYGNTLIYKASNDKNYNYVFKYDLLDEKATKISDTYFSVGSIEDGKIYYADNTGYHYVKTYDLKTDTVEEFSKAHAYMVYKNRDYMYYIDLENNYSLVRLNLNTRSSTVLFQGSEDEHCITYNVYKNVVYYYIQSADTGNIYKINADGTNPQLVLTDVIDGIYCTSTLSFATTANDNKVYIFDTFADTPNPKLLKVQ